MKKSTYFPIVGTAMLSAIAFILMILDFPLLPAATYLKMDFSDFPCIIAAAVFGPVYGVIAELVKNLLDLIIRGIGTQLGFGNLLNFVVGCSFILPFSILMKKLKKYTVVNNLIISSAISLISMVIVGLLSNYVIAPLFFKYFLHIELTHDAVIAAALVSVPFNAIKATILSVLIILLWNPLILRLKKMY